MSTYCIWGTFSDANPFAWQYLVTVLFLISPCRHRPVLEKCYDIDHVMKVGIIFSDTAINANLMKLSSRHLIWIYSVPTGEDHSGIWREVHLHNVWLSYQWWLLPRCQSGPQAEICAGANAVPERCWWCLFPVSWWAPATSPAFPYNMTAPLCF